ncbi:uncharacterized protein LOC110700421 isoform X2 [Chenopodium quinoa]|uniref:uncharacterized protein LOC110700421 isoform X2 n=1 Tax=Chenopodium quinoa TaxID=63459 RepID=UPI000B78AEFC|nr:uncharacterized protein LOC110700421 isoform X2 [Chenopodium quinoa]
MTLAKKTDNELVKTKEKVDSCGPIKSEHSTIKGKGITIPENIVESLGKHCSMLYYCMTSGSGDYDTTIIPLKAPLFYKKEDTQIYVTSDDVSELLRGAWANISLIHVYILYLIEEHISLFQKTKIKFLCSQKISADEIKKDFLEVQMYLKNAFLTKLRKKDAQCKFILAPYMEANHWVLYVIDLHMSLVYEFDSVIQSPPNARNSELSKVMKMSHVKGNSIKTSKPQLLHIRMELLMLMLLCASSPIVVVMLPL